MLRLPIQDLMDYQKCYQFLVKIFHPNGLHCNCGWKLPECKQPHKYNSTRLPSYKCSECGKVFNVFTQTIFQGIHYSCIQIVLLLRGIAQGITTLHLSKELEVNYKNLLEWRHLLQELSYENRNVFPLQDKAIESDEVFINAGEKGERHDKEEDPPRVRANKKKA